MIVHFYLNEYQLRSDAFYHLVVENLECKIGDKEYEKRVFKIAEETVKEYVSKAIAKDLDCYYTTDEKDAELLGFAILFKDEKHIVECGFENSSGLGAW